jgi:SagB-type dehydrogenase family enzyme
MILPKPETRGDLSVEQAIHSRRTVRSFSSEAVILFHLSQLLWAAQGITEDAGGLRSVPSAGALYPTEIYAVTGQNAVEGLEAGVHQYRPAIHGLDRISGRDIRQDIGRASLSQMWLANAPVVIVICSEYERVTGKYGQRGVRYAMIEAGHVAENIFLQACASGMAAGIVGAFMDEDVVRIMDIPATHEPLLIMPAGYPA